MRRLLKRSVYAGLVGPLVLFPGPSEPVPTGSVEVVAITEPLLLARDESCDTDCETCGPDEHYAVGVEPEEANANRNEGWHNWPDCKTGECEFTHGPMCVTFTASDVEELLVSLRDRNAHGIRTVLSEHGQVVSLNTARMAIQVADCSGKGEIWAHLPIPEGLASSLVEE